MSLLSNNVPDMSPNQSYGAAFCRWSMRRRTLPLIQKQSYLASIHGKRKTPTYAVMTSGQHHTDGSQLPHKNQ